MITIEEVRQFQKAIGTAAWKLDLWKFAETMGQDADHERHPPIFPPDVGQLKAALR